MAQASNNFTKVGEQILQNRISNSNLNENEKAEIWETVKQRDEDIKQEKFNVKSQWKERVHKEYERLRASQRPEAHLRFNPPRSPNQNYRGRAIDNVIASHKAYISNLYKIADRKINSVFKQAHENDRNKQQDHNLKQDFQNANENEPPR